MLVHLIRKLLVTLVVLWVSDVQAQNPVKRGLIEVLSPKGVDISQPGAVIYKYTGNVKLRHQKVLLFCDQTIHYVTANRIEAVGHVLIVQGDTIIVKSDSLLYDGNSQQATVYGRVIFQDRRIILTTAKLDYSLTSGVAHYANRGRLVDSRNVLTSREGFYDTRTRKAELQQSVRLAGPESTLTSEVLIYNTVSRLATIVRPTRISGKEGMNVAQQGQYDTQNSVLQQNTTEETLKYVGADVPTGRADSEGADPTKSGAIRLTKVDKPAVADQNSRSVAAGKGASPGKEAEKPMVASLKAKKDETTATESVSQAGATYASIGTVSEKIRITDEAKLKTVAKNTAGTARKPVVPAEEVGGRAMMVPTEKLDDPSSLATGGPQKAAPSPNPAQPAPEATSIVRNDGGASARLDQYTSQPGAPLRSDADRTPISAAAAMTRLAVKPTKSVAATTSEPKKLPAPINQVVATVGTVTEKSVGIGDENVAPKLVETAPKLAVESPVVHQAARAVSEPAAKNPDTQVLLTMSVQKVMPPTTSVSSVVKPASGTGRDSTAGARPGQYAAQSNALPPVATKPPTNLKATETIASAKTPETGVAEPVKTTKPISTGQNNSIIAAKKPAVKPVTPVAVVTPEPKKSPVSADKAEVAVVTVGTVTEKSVNTTGIMPKPSEAKPKSAAKTPVAVERESAKPVKTVNEPLPKKSDDQALSTIVSSQKTAPDAPASLVTDPKFKLLTGTRAGVVPDLKRVAAPARRVTADTSVSDLERELNRKRRVN